MPIHSQTNGLSERKIRHIVDTGLTLLAHAHVPLKFWSFAFRTAINSINSMPTPVLQNSSPFQKLFNKSPSYIDTKIFGYAIYTYLRPYNKAKFSFRS